MERSTFQFGYLVTEVPVPKREVAFHARVHRVARIQVPVCKSWGPHVEGVALPRAERAGWVNQKAAVEGRLGCEMPMPDYKLLDEMWYWGVFLCAYLLTPIGPGGILKFLQWLELTHYPRHRKGVLTEVESERLRSGKSEEQTLEENKDSTGFEKDEWYPEYKIPRGIHPEPEVVKCIMGRLFKSIELVVYALTKYFVKHVPVLQRPAHIMSTLRVAGNVYLQTDFKSFEAGFWPALMHRIEFHMYRFMLRNNPRELAIMNAYEKIRCGWCLVKYKDVQCRVKGRRLSGQMCTSLGNTWTNFVMLTFMMAKAGVRFDDMRVACEGDDGLASVSPNVAGFMARSKIPEQCGMKMTMETSRELSEASFCGINFDEQDLVNITDPWPKVADFGWVSGAHVTCNKQKLLALGRAKAMSLAYQYYRCPILFALARYGLRVTVEAKSRVHKMLTDSPFLNEYERPLYLQAEEFLNKGIDFKASIPLRTRFLMERTYGVSVAQQQAIEWYLDHHIGLEPLQIDVPVVLWKHCWWSYVKSFVPGTTWHSVTHSRPYLI